MSGLRPELSALMHFVDYPGPASLTDHPLWCLWCLAGRRYQRRERVEISGFGRFFVHRRVARARAHNATARVALDRLTFHDDSASQARNTVEHSR